MTAETTGRVSDADKMRKLINESNALQKELTSVTAELKEVTRQRDALHPGKGRVVVELPEPDDGFSAWFPAGIVLVADPNSAWPHVGMDFGHYSIDWPVDVARDVFVAGLAACDRAKRVST